MKSLSRELVDRAILAMVAGIEVYNKPGFPYRNESFTILAINAWELLLKAKWLELHNNNKRSLYIYERRAIKSGKRSTKEYIKRTRSKSPFTHELGYLARQLVTRKVLHPSATQNIDIMLEFRDCATHFLNENPSFENRLYEISAACVKNFANVAREWFGREVTEFDIHLMPLTFMTLPSSVAASLLNAEESNFLAFLDSVDEPAVDPESPYSVSVNIELKFIRSKAKDAFPVQVTGDSSAFPVKLTEEDIRQRYPWDYLTLTEKCKQRYEDFKANQLYHSIRKNLETDERYGRTRLLDPSNADGQKKTFFNPNILSEFDKHYSKLIANPFTPSSKPSPSPTYAQVRDRHLLER